jgi:hypothetical protein
MMPVDNRLLWIEKKRNSEELSENEASKRQRFKDGFTFSEEQVKFKNQGWEDLKGRLLREVDDYTWLSNLMSNMNSWPLDRVINFLNYADNKYLEGRGETRKQWEDIITDQWSPEIEGRLLNAIPMLTKELMENTKYFEDMEAAGMVPDFTNEPLRRYRKWNTASGRNTKQGDYIDVEEYEVESPEGDVMRWAMAKDSDGRIYIDNVYDPTVGMDDNGCFKKKLNMGMLVYKPEDYDSQALAVPKEYREPGSYYTDISKFLALRWPIKKYIGALGSRTGAKAA